MDADLSFSLDVCLQMTKDGSALPVFALRAADG